MKSVGCCSELHGRTPPPATLVPLPFQGRLYTNLQTPYPIKSPTYTGKIPEYQHYRYRQGQQPALASHRRTARYERIPPNGFDMAALEVMFHEEIPPALRATSLFKGGYLFRLPHELSFFFRDGYSTGISHCHPNNFLHRKIFLRIS